MNLDPEKRIRDNSYIRNVSHPAGVHIRKGDHLTAVVIDVKNMHKAMTEKSVGCRWRDWKSLRLLFFAAAQLVLWFCTAIKNSSLTKTQGLARITSTKS